MYWIEAAISQSNRYKVYIIYIIWLKLSLAAKYQFNKYNVDKIPNVKKNKNRYIYCMCSFSNNSHPDNTNKTAEMQCRNAVRFSTIGTPLAIYY